MLPEIEMADAPVRVEGMGYDEDEDDGPHL